LIIKLKDKEELYKKVPKFERMFRIMIQRTHETMMNRLISTISQPAEERYLNFISKYPSIPQRVPQHQIASFLGISPEFLSKIKAKLAKHR
jgi:CRP-like cAMP-binding protein